MWGKLTATTDKTDYLPVECLARNRFTDNGFGKARGRKLYLDIPRRPITQYKTFLKRSEGAVKKPRSRLANPEE
jgi:hypothetical protein